jgi:hypothetical protein
VSYGDGAVHGTASTYRSVFYGCRCKACRAAHTERKRQERAVLRARQADAPHGTSTAYSNWGCRCDACKAAYRIRNAANRGRRKLAAGESLSALEERGLREIGSTWVLAPEGTARAVVAGEPGLGVAR